MIYHVYIERDVHRDIVFVFYFILYVLYIFYIAVYLWCQDNFWINGLDWVLGEYHKYIFVSCDFPHVDRHSDF